MPTRKKQLSDATREEINLNFKKNKIYLLINNLRTKRPFKKFDYRKIDPFFVKIVKKL